jgi:hypothetical protein
VFTLALDETYKVVTYRGETRSVLIEPGESTSQPLTEIAHTINHGDVRLNVELDMSNMPAGRYICCSTAVLVSHGTGYQL